MPSPLVQDAASFGGRQVSREAGECLLCSGHRVHADFATDRPRRKERRVCTIRSEARPSHRGGGWYPAARRRRFPLVCCRTEIASCRSFCGSVPTTRLVPCVTVTCLSVLSRKVRQGTPRYVVSS